MQLEFGRIAIDSSDRALDREPLGSGFLAFLRAYVADTYHTCSFHRRRMQRAQVSPDDIASFDDLRRIPLLTSDDVAGASELDLLPDDYRAASQGAGLGGSPVGRRLAKKFNTTGSTGAPKVSYYTVTDWEVTLAVGARMLAHIPWGLRTRGFNCFNAGHVGGKFFEDSQTRSGAFIENRHFSLTTPEEVLRQLYRGYPDAGGFNAMFLPPCLPPGLAVKKGVNLADLLEVDVDNYIGDKIRCIVTGGAPRDLAEPGQLGVVERVWESNALAGAERARFFDMYGSAECTPIAGECEYNDGAHVLPVPAHVEVIDLATMRPVKHGERGFIVVTALRTGTRFVRYLLGDEATYLDEPCRCGRATPRLKDVVRVMDRERLRQGCAAG